MIVAAHSTTLSIVADGSRWFLTPSLALTFTLLPVLFILRGWIGGDVEGVQVYRDLGAGKGIIASSILVEWCIIGAGGAVAGSLAGLLVAAALSPMLFSYVLSMPLMEAVLHIVHISSSCVLGIAVGVVAGVYSIWRY